MTYPISSFSVKALITGSSTILTSYGLTETTASEVAQLLLEHPRIESVSITHQTKQSKRGRWVTSTRSIIPCDDHEIDPDPYSIYRKHL